MNDECLAMSLRNWQGRAYRGGGLVIRIICQRQPSCRLIKKMIFLQFNVCGFICIIRNTSQFDAALEHLDI